jgi:hypothetical protein
VRDKKTTFEIKNLNCEESLPGWVLFDDRSFPQYRKVSAVPQPPPFFLVCVCVCVFWLSGRIGVDSEHRNHTVVPFSSLWSAIPCL